MKIQAVIPKPQANNMNTPIDDFLQNYDKARFHMPGHKGDIYKHDITEVTDADSLYEAVGIIRQSEKNASLLFGSLETNYSCSGSTLAIQAMLALGGFKKIASLRYCHKSFVNACILLDIDVDWIFTESIMSTEISETAIIPNGCDALYVTYTDYYGRMCSLDKINNPQKIPLLADNAHGAHFAFLNDKKYIHPLRQGAVLCADSAHKTLPVLTGGAYLHVNDKSFTGKAKEKMSLFGTSSPSYLILQSLDICNKYIEKNLGEFDITAKKTADTKEILRNYGYEILESDPFKITINCRSFGYTGKEISRILHENMIECEYSDEAFIVLMTSCKTADFDYQRLINTLLGIEKRCMQGIEIFQIRPKKAMSMREAYFSKKQRIDIKDALGRINSGVYAPCPPAVPIIMPGEIFDEETIFLLIKYGNLFADVVYL